MSNKKCIVCGNKIPPGSKRYKYCSQKCKWKYWNDKKTRKTSKSYKKAEKARNKNLTKREKQIIYGTLLGDGSLTPSTTGYNLSLTHGLNQKEYLQWKINNLSTIIHTSYNTYTKGNYNQASVKSIYHPFLSKIRNLLYENNSRKVNLKFLNKINSLGLSVFYLDDGSFNKNYNSRQITLSTEGFGKKGSELISDWLLSKFNIPSTILEYTQKKHGYSSKQKQQFRLTINRNESLKMFSIIKEHIPKCMFYKLPDKIK